MIFENLHVSKWDKLDLGICDSVLTYDWFNSASNVAVSTGHGN